jgi:hypothetical protein
LIARYWGQDATLYLGILPLVFALYGLVTVRKPLFSIFTFMAFMLFCLSLANTTVVAKVLYYGFLPFRFLRYVGNMGAVIRFFLFLLAGYGLEHFLKNRDFRHHRKWAAANNRIFLVCSLGVLCLMLLVKAFILLIANPLFPGYEPFPGFLYFTCALTAAASWFLVQKNFTSRKLALIFILFFAADILGYQTLFQTSWPYRIHEMSRSAVRIHSFPYQASRNFSPPGDQRTNAALKLVQLNPFRLAEEMYSFLLFDPSIPSKNVRAFHWSSGVHELISLRFPDFYTSTNQPDFVRKEENQPFATIFGISQPKLRLLSNIRFANNHGTARKMISSPLFDADRLTLLEKVPASLQTRWQRTNPPANVEGTIEVKNFSFNRLGLEADVKYPGGAWLYYADAWHTGWHARVNGRTAPVSRANLAFKAVFLPPGKNFVQFDYFDGLQSLLSNLLAVTGILFCLVMSGFLFKTLVRGNTPCS